MVTEQTAETEVTDSVLATPDSDSLEQAVSDVLEQSEQVEGEETPEDAGDATGESEGRLLESYSFEELNELYRRGQLNDPELVTRREQFIQSDRDRREKDTQRLASIQAAEFAANQALEAQRSMALNALDESLTQIQDASDPAVTNAHRQLVAQHLGRFQQATEQKALARIDAEIIGGLLNVYGDTAENRERFRAWTTDQKAGALLQAGYDLRDQQIREQQEKTAQQARKAADDAKARKAPPANPNLNGASGTAAGRPSLEQIQSWTRAEFVSRFPNKDDREKVLAEAHLAAARKAGVR